MWNVNRVLVCLNSTQNIRFILTMWNVNMQIYNGQPLTDSVLS